MDQLKTANRNIKLYVFVRIFAKRVFIPLTAIYFIDTSGFTIREIGLLSAFFSLIQLLAEVPTGYFADRIGRVASIRVGAILAAFATTIYVYIHHKTGIYLGVMLEALGYSFLGGAGEALIHDSLVIKNKVADYTKVLSRTQSVSLIANAALIALVPMTYTINKTYPFVIGTLAYLLLFTFALFMHDVTRSVSVATHKFQGLTHIAGKRHLLLFALTFGIIAAMYTSPSDMFNIALRDYGINVSLIGWVYALGSILGALIGPVFHHLRKLRLSSYLLIDVTSLLSVYLAAFTRQPYLLVAAVIFGIGFWRYRRIIYQDYLLTIYPTKYKATLISAMNNLEQLNAIWLPLLITSSVYYFGISRGLGLIGLFGLFIAPFFVYSTLRFFRRDPLMVVANQTTDNV